MLMDRVVPGVTLAAAVAAFGLAAGLSLRVGVEPLYAVLRGIAGFAAVLWIARLSAGALTSAGLGSEQDRAGTGGGSSNERPRL